MFDIINEFKELTDAKEIKKAKLITTTINKRKFLGVKVWYDNESGEYIFDDEDNLKGFIKDLEDMGITTDL